MVYRIIERTLQLDKILGEKASAFLFGARGVGKSYLTKQWLSKESKTNRTVFYDFLKFDVYERYLKDPSLFRKEIESQIKDYGFTSVLVDEVQKIPSVLDEVHWLLEEYPKKIRFLLTGSSARKLKRENANMLGGRAFSLKLHPFTHTEYEEDILDVLKLGSLPKVVFAEESKLLTLKSYVETYLKEEIQQEAQIRKIAAFARFFEIAGQFHGKITNTAEIAKYAGISSKTVEEYFQILEDTLIGFRIYGWTASVKKQLLLKPKFYLFDNGVVNCIRGELTVDLKMSSSRFGELFEAYIIQEIVRYCDYEQLEIKLTYWRTNTGMEVDLILSRGISEPFAAIEIKSSTNPDLKSLSGLKSFSTEYPKAKLFCFCRTENQYSLEEIKILPWQVGIKLIKKM